MQELLVTRGFPPLINKTAPVGGSLECPFDLTMIREYMRSNLSDFGGDTAHSDYNELGLRAHLRFETRQFWIWSYTDDIGQCWDVVVGSGLSPFVNDTSSISWICATLFFERYDPLEVVLKDFPEHRDEEIMPN